MIDEAPKEAAWADASSQLANLQRDLKIDPGARDGELEDAFNAALRRLGGSKGRLGRSLVPTVERRMLPTDRTAMHLPLPPVLQIIGFERRVDAEWVEVTGVRHWLERDVLEWSLPGGVRDVRVVYHAGYLDDDPDLKVIVPALRLMARQIVDGHDDRVQATIDTLLEGLQVYG